MSSASEDGGRGAGGPLDAETLAQLREVGGDRLVRELMEVFAQHTPERLRSVAESHAAGDLQGAAAALHSLRSAAGTVGARRLAELAGELERSARGGAAETLSTGLAELRRRAAAALTAARALAGSG